MTLATTKRVCAGADCGTILSRFNPDDYCAACMRRLEDQEPDPCEGAVDLERLIAGLLLVHDAQHPGEPVNVQQALSALGVDADAERVQLAMRHIARRHGLIARGVRGRPGYTVVDWETRYRPVVGFGGSVMIRDDEGRWAATVAPLLHRSEQQREVRAPQMSLFGAE